MEVRSIQLTLRDYQQQLYEGTYQAMRDGHRRVLVVLSTGGGKTAVFAWMAHKAQLSGSVVWFLVHRRELLEQALATFERFEIPTDGIHVGMVGQVARNADRFPRPDLIIFDEAHHSQAGTWRKIIDRYPDTWIIGLTATPARLDGKPLGEIYQTMVQGPTTAELIQRGWLSPYRAYSVNVADLAALRKRGSDYDQDDAAEHLMQRAVYGDVIQHYRELADGLQAICFCTTIRHSEAMAQAFRDAGISAVHLDGGTPKRERQREMQRFRDGETTVLSSVDLFGEGLDIPDCAAVIQLRPTQSLTLHLQQLGRALRPREGKTAILLDHVGNLPRLGLPDDDRDWTLTDTLPPPSQHLSDGRLRLRTCASCYAVFEAVGRDTCPVCGAWYEPTREEIEHIEQVRLVEIKRRREQHQQAWRDKRTREIETEADCRTYQDLLIFAEKCGHDDPRRYAIARSYALGIPRPWDKRERRRRRA